MKGSGAALRGREMGNAMDSNGLSEAECAFGPREVDSLLLTSFWFIGFGNESISGNGVKMNSR